MRIEWVNRDGDPIRLRGWPVAIGLGVLFSVLIFGVFDVLRWKPRPVAAERVWEYVVAVTRDRSIDPMLVYHICWAESSLDAHARSTVARGIMQLTREAWTEGGVGAYRRAFNWRRNIDTGVNYLELCRNVLPPEHRDDRRFLAAAYRFGPYSVRAGPSGPAGFPAVKNEIYRGLIYAGEYTLRPPGEG